MDSKILITGAAGFIGSHLVEYCTELGYSIVCFDRYNPQNHWGWLEHSKYRNDFEMVLGDIRDYDSVSRAMRGCSHVFHLAAMGSVPYSYVSPLAFVRTNVEGTYNVLEAARQIGSVGVHITSTSETYGTAKYIPMDENHPLIPQSPYAATKTGADQLAISYFRSFDLPITILRPFNTYGPRQSTRAVIPTIITQLLTEQESIVLGNLASKRDFSFVSDICHAYVETYQSSNLVGQIFNVGMGKSISILNLAETIMNKMDKKIEIKEGNDRLRPVRSEVWDLVCDNNLIIEKTHWKPLHNIDRGLDLTIAWYSNPDYFELSKRLEYVI